MLLSPRYTGPSVLTLDGDPNDVLAPLVSQRRRLESTLATLSDEQWNAPSRCAAWTVRDVVAHLVSINPLYVTSAVAGLAGEPTRLMQHFDPAVSPPVMVDSLGAMGAEEVLAQFVATNDELVATVERLTEPDWSVRAESPPGHVTIRLLMSHALWDAWIHERDILIPLGIEPTVDAREVTASLRYVAALGSAFALGAGCAFPGVFAIEATDPDFACLLEVDGSVRVRTVPAPVGAPLLRGTAVELTEVLSTRVPLPDTAPAEWRRVLQGLEYAWDLSDRPSDAGLSLEDAIQGGAL